jgi:hypothetical protein
VHRKLSFPLFALIAALTLLPPAALAQVGVPAPLPSGQAAPIDQPTVQPDTAAGALAAIGCGIFVRASIITAGTQVGTIVGAVACCGFMFFDAFVLEAH